MVDGGQAHLHTGQPFLRTALFLSQQMLKLHFGSSQAGHCMCNVVVVVRHT